MIPGGHYVCSSHAREDYSTNDREERILAVLGIIGTILNLVTGCFLVLCFSGLMWEPDTEQREKEQSLKLTGCCMRRERRLLQCDSNKENDQYATSIQGELEVFPNGCSISLRVFCGPIREENPGGESRPSAVQTDTECTHINRTTQLKLSPFIGSVHAQTFLI
uniref:Uncharacterized protein n=1 Tax=Nothobranchius kuhntae TaxID=321403 RepID=A0A1A8KVC0_NOTKU